MAVELKLVANRASRVGDTVPIDRHGISQRASRRCLDEIPQRLIETEAGADFRDEKRSEGRIKPPALPNPRFGRQA